MSMSKTEAIEKVELAMKLLTEVDNEGRNHFSIEEIKTISGAGLALSLQFEDWDSVPVPPAKGDDEE